MIGTKVDGETETQACGAASFLKPLSLESVRFGGEEVYAQELMRIPGVLGGGAEVAADPARIRRGLMARSLLLTEGMAPAVYTVARRCATLFGIEAPVEIFQAAGAENAAMHLVASPALLEVQGRLLALLDEGALAAVLGHELGHYLAHGPDSPHAPLIGLLARLLHGDGVPDDVLGVALRYSMARELTADRLGLLACGSLDAALRLEMVSITGLSGEALTWDTQAYLAQSRSLMEETLARGETALASSHPEHSLRTYALWLFSETDVYRALTGIGPATRSLAEVDDVLLRILGRPDVQLCGAEIFDEPPPEMQECALAACVLVAAADGELHDAEVEAIERVFAALLPEWRTLLDPDYAMARFQVLAPLIRNGGPRLERALFSLLVHVLAVDGEAHEREVDTVLAIGAALGCPELFRSLMVPVLGHFGLSAEMLVRCEAVIPMPARSAEAQAALHVYFAETAKRGGGRVSLRRLLRLLGETRCHAEALAAIEREAERAGLVFEPPLGDELDRIHQLALTAAAAAARAGSPLAPPAGQGGKPERLRNGLARLRDRLISGDGRSPSVRLRTCRSGRNVDLHLLERVSTGLAERTLALVRAGRKARLVDAAEAGTHEGARAVTRELVALEREHRARVEETGAHDLHLGYPFVTGLVGGYLFRAPLLLYPVRIERGDMRSPSFALAPVAEAEPLANQSALRLMFARKGLPYPDELAARLDDLALESPDAVLGELARLGLPAVELSGQLQAYADRSEELDTWRDDRLEVEECAVLGLFPQSNSDLLQDYDELLVAVDRGAAPGELLGCAVDVLPGDLKAAYAAPLTVPAEQPAAPSPVIYADPSQRAVLRRARECRTLVVDGPPGTGKSQVIVNLVADALARGERVAVVCEKRAALDVVANRLETVGMRHLLAVVHDVQDDRRGLFDQIAQRLTEAGQRSDPGEAFHKVAGEAKALFAGLKDKAAALAIRSASLALGELHTFAAALEAKPAEHRDSLDRLELESMERAAAEFERLRPFADLWTPGSPWLAPKGMARTRLSGFDAMRLEETAQAVRGALAAAQGLESACAEQGFPSGQLASVAQARLALTAAAECNGHVADDADRAMLSALLFRAVRGMPGCDELDAATVAWREAGEATLRFGAPVRLTPDAPQMAALGTIERIGASPLRFLNPSWWRARAEIGRLLAAQWPERAGARVDGALVAEIRARHAAARAWAALDAVAALADGVRPPQEAATAAAWLGHVGQLARDSVALAGLRSVLEKALAWPEAFVPAAMEDWARRIEARRALLARRDALAAAMQPLRGLLPWWPDTPAALELQTLAEAWERDGKRLAEADRHLAAATSHYAHAEELLRSLARTHGAPVPGAWADAVRKSWSFAGIAAIETSHPPVRRLDEEGGDTDARQGAQLGQLMESGAKLAAQRLLARQDERPFLRVPDAEKGRRRTPEQAEREAMLKEVRKKSRLMPLRSFARRFWNTGLLDVLPVWLMSPETVAVLFPRAPVFDLVIVDEGSQCTVESGLPVLMRARRGVIAGDERQMPPTSFFKSGNENDDAEAASEAREMFDAESLLVLARARADHIGLQWHYRCLHEELIAFSNHALYGGTLRTIPSTASRLAPSAIEWVAVPDGRYEDGANPIEAARVVDLMSEMLARPDKPTLGVVTFNLMQRRAIFDEIDARRAADAGFAALFDEANSRPQMDQRPFVKNLESVQGDERDFVIFSLGHAPTERKRRDGRTERYVPARFGPLGQRGGERRLNVAVSRAKRGIVVVASFEPGLLSVARSKNEGPKLFKAFLEFAHHMAGGRRNQAERVLSLVRALPAADRAAPSFVSPAYVPLKAQIALALEERGVRCEMDVGTSDFRLPLTVTDVADPSRYLACILCDEGREARSPLETHVHVPNVLAMRGWKALRVTGREWERDREGVLSRIAAVAEEPTP